MKGGIGRSALADSSLERMDISSERKTVKYSRLVTTIPTTAFQPKPVNMYSIPQFHLPATMTTGGAAKCVSVPPTEMFTKRRPRVA